LGNAGLSQLPLFLRESFLIHSGFEGRLLSTVTAAQKRNMSEFQENGEID
jgi:hypothetical protein